MTTQTLSSYNLSFKFIDRKLLVLLALPLLLILLNDSWIFLDDNLIDPWIYFGYFLDLKQHLKTFSNVYFGTRLPWILPGFLSYQLFSPFTAAYVLFLTFYYAAVISLYLILKHTVGSKAALLAAVLMGCHCFFLRAIGGNYIDGAGLTYFLLTLLMLTYGAKHPSPYLFLAGVFYGCLIYTQLFLVIFTPSILLYYFFINQTNRPPLRLNLKLFTSGFTGLTLLLCIINYCLNGKFFFFLPCWAFLADFASKPNPWWLPFSTWWMSASWLLLPTLTFLGALAVLISYRAKIFFQIFFILNAFIFIGVEIFFKQPALSLSFYASYLLPMAFLALGSQLSLAINEMKRHRFYWLLGSISLLSLLSFICPVHFQWLKSINPLLLPILLALVGFLSLMIQRPYCKEISALFISTSIITVTLTSTNPQIYRHSDLHKQSFLSVVKGVRAIQSLNPHRKTRFWYNVDTPFGSTFQSVASTYLWGHRLVNEAFPDVHDRPRYPPVLNNHIFILSNEENVMEKANQNLAQIGLKGEFINEKIVEQGPIHYKITLFSIAKLTEAHACH